MFIRLNSLDTRWAPLGRLIMRYYFPPNMDGAAASSVVGRRGVRKLRTVQLVIDQLQWSMHLRPADGSHNIRSRRGHLFNVAPLDEQPDISQCSSLRQVELDDPQVAMMPIAHDIWTGWGTALQAPSSPVDVYTDGSYVRPSVPSTALTLSRPLPCPHSSSWAVVVSDSWLASAFSQIPEEQLLLPRHVTGATMFGSAINDGCTRGVYPAEL